MLPATSLHHIGTGLWVLGLALMIGGMLALGAFTAPLVFKTLPRDEAGLLMGQIFARYDQVLLGALVMCLMGEGLRWASGSGQLGLKEGLFAILSGCVLYSTLALTPQIQAYQAQKQTPSAVGTSISAESFSKTHSLAETLYKAQLLMAIVLIFLTPFQLKLTQTTPIEVNSTVPVNVSPSSSQTTDQTP